MKYIKDFFDKNSIFSVEISIISMLLAHAFCFMNIMYAHDSLLFYDTSALYKVGFGRFLYPFYVRERLIATPWLVGVLCMVFVALSTVLVMKIFDFSKLQCFCVAVLFSTNITLISLFSTYIFDADVDCLALLLACFSVYVFKVVPKHWNIVVSSIFMVICLALYQAYICVSIGLFILLLLYNSKKCKNWDDVVIVLLDGIKELVSIAIAAILYYISMNMASRYFGVALSSGYNGAGNLKNIKGFDIINAIPGAYNSVKEYFFNVTSYNGATMVRLNMVLLFVIIMLVILYIISNKVFLGSLLIVVPSLILLPLGVGSIYLISMGTLHQLMIFAYNLLFLIPFVLITEIDSDLLKKIQLATSRITVLIITLIAVHNIIYANGEYTHKKIVYDNTLLHAQSIWKDINSIEGYTEGETPVVFIGNFEGSNIVYRGPIGEKYVGTLTGTTDTAITYNPTAYFYGILGRKMNIIYDDSIIANNDEYKKIEIYPKKGYCQMIGDKIVVRISE